MFSIDLSKQVLTPNPQLLRGVTDVDDYVVVFSSYYWGKKVDKAETVPNMYFYDIKKQKNIDTINGGLVFLKFNHKTKDVLYLTNKQWL